MNPVGSALVSLTEANRTHPSDSVSSSSPPSGRHIHRSLPSGLLLSRLGHDACRTILQDHQVSERSVRRPGQPFGSSAQFAAGTQTPHGCAS